MRIKKILKNVNWLKLVVALVVTFMAAALGSLFTTSAIPDWYQLINKPSFNPPNWIFGPVWTVLYFLMAISAYLVWDKESVFKKKKVCLALAIFISQLVINAIWSIVFFGLHSLGGAYIVIIALIVLIVATMIAFSKISKLAYYLLIPYLCWVCFASILNLAIVLLN